MRWTTLVEVSALATAAPDDVAPVIIDARFSLGDPSAGEGAHALAHLPGAHYAHLDRDLSAARRSAPGAGRHPWPSEATLQALCLRTGIVPGRQVVVYDDGDSAFASRLWWLLRVAGHVEVAVLDGGWAAWTGAGLPVSAEPVPDAQASAPRVVFDRALLVDADGVVAHLAAGGLLLDARATPRFRGEVEPIDARAGHVPGAVSRPYADNLVDGRFKSPAALAGEFDALLDGRDPAAVVAMCGSGVTACHHLLAMAHARREGARLYTGSWSGWIEDPARPVALGD